MPDSGARYGPDGRLDLYHGLVRWDTGGDGRPRVTRYQSGPTSMPCPNTGRSLRIATLDATAPAPASCPSCAVQGHGGFVSFDGDLRMACACPICLRLVWLQGV